MSSTLEATFAVKLKDDTSGAARSAANALKDLKERIDDDVKALREMQKAQRLLKGGTSTSTAAFAELKDKIAAQKATIATAQSKFIELGGAFGKANEGANEAKGGIAELAKKVFDGGGAVNSLKGALKSASPLLAGLAGGALVVVVAFVAFAVAVGKVVYELAKYAVAQSDARRSEQLEIEGLNSLDRMRRRYTASVDDHASAIDRVADRTNLGRGALAGYARQLARAGLQGDDLRNSLEAMSFAAQVQGEAGAQRFLGLTRSVRGSGKAVRDLADRYRSELGPIARREMMSIENQTSRFKKNLERIFGGLRLDGFLQGLSKIGDLFSQSTVTGRALKHLVDTLFQPLIDQTTEALPLVTQFIQRLVIGALRATAGYLTLNNVFKKVRNQVQGVSALLKTFFLGGFGESFATAITGGRGAATNAARGLAKSISDTFAGELGIHSPSRVFAGFGVNISEGLARGMNVSAVQRSARALADGASGAFADRLEIASPSRLFAGYGEDITAGVQQGLGSFDLEVGGETVGEAPQGGGRQASSAVSISVGDIHITAAETDEPRDLAMAFRDQLAAVLQGLSIELGGA